MFIAASILTQVKTYILKLILCFNMCLNFKCSQISICKYKGTVLSLWNPKRGTFPVTVTQPMHKHIRKFFLDSKVTVLKSHHTQMTHIKEKVSFTEVMTFCTSKF